MQGSKAQRRTSPAIRLHYRTARRLSARLTQHRDEFYLDVLLQKVEPARPEARQHRRLEMLIELFARAPVFIEDEQVRIVVAHVQMIVDARCLLARWIDEA